jgi:hypothetical protein
MPLALQPDVALDENGERDAGDVRVRAAQDRHVPAVKKRKARVYRSAFANAFSLGSENLFCRPGFYFNPAGDQQAASRNLA